MKFLYTALAVVLAIAPSPVTCRDVPSNVAAFKKRITNGKCTGGKILQDGFQSEDPGSKTFAYCQDNATGVLYIHGDGDQLTNMDVDCDGLQGGHHDNRCKSSTDTQDVTAYQYLVQQYSKENGHEVKDLNANFDPYVVFGNYGHKKGYLTFHPTDYGVQPLSVMAVVCGNKLIYGVWGDQNGDDGPSLVGEASLALATACYGKKVNGNNGHSPNDVLFIAFPGSVNETVNKNADWAATDYNAFEDSITALGDKLIEKLK